MNYELGIIGGLGPLASCYFYKLITEKTKANKDQDHLNIIILSDAKTPDRTEYILDNTKESPYPYLLRDCQTLEKLGCKLISIPCNTSSYFHEELKKHINIPISNMIENTTNYIKDKYKTAAILATTGTITSKLYQNALEKNGIKYVFPNQENVMTIIYDYIKQGKEVPLTLLNDTIKDLNCDCYILGCTELSILKEKLNLNDNFIDPLEIEAEKILDFFGKERLWKHVWILRIYK